MLACAQLGDALAEVDPAPGEAHNYFALLGIRPQDLLRRLVKNKGCTPTASLVASLLGVNLADEILASCIPRITFQGRQTLPAGDAPPLVGIHGSRMVSQSPEEVGTSQREDRIEAQPPSKSSVPLEESPKVRGGNGHFWSTAAASEPLCSCQLCRRASAILQQPSPNYGPYVGRGQPAYGAVPTLFRVPFQPSIPKPPCPAPTSRFPHPSRTGREGAEKEADAEENPSGPDLDTAEINKVMSGRKARLPGLSGDEKTPPGLTPDLLTKLATVAPFRCTVAALLELLSRRGGLTGGAFPVVPAALYTAPDGGLEGSEVSYAPSPGARGLERGKRGVEGLATDEELLEFSLQQSAERYPLLHRWIRLQLHTNSSLADLRENPGIPRLLPPTIQPFHSIVRPVTVRLVTE
jgi:hypothetical protein